MHKFRKKSDATFYFVNILISIDKIKRSAQNFSSPYEMVSNEYFFSLVIRELQEIGESIKKLLRKYEVSEKSNVEWRNIVDLRNLVVHQYFSIDSDIIFEIVQSEIPLLEGNILELVKKFSDKTDINKIIAKLKVVFQKNGRHETVAYLIELEDWIRNLARV